MSKTIEGVLRIELEGVHLTNMNGWMGASDCFWQAETPLTTPDGTLLWQGIFRSETIMDTLNPRWKPACVSIDLKSQYDRHKPLRFSFYDWEANMKPQPMGHFMTSINQLLRSKADKTEDGSWDLAKAIITKNHKGEEFGTIVIVDVEIVEQEHAKCIGSSSLDETSVLQLTLEGVELAKMNGMFGLSDPYYIVETPVKGPNGTVEWEKFHQSESIRETVNPVWAPASLNIKALCGKNVDKPIRISVFDEEDKGQEDQPMGHCITTVRRLLKSGAKKGDDGKWELTKALFLVNEQGQEFGRVVVVDAKIASSETAD